MTIATGSIAIPAERWYNMEKDVENCRTETDKLEFIEFPVIASQFANWRGNPPVRSTNFR